MERFVTVETEVFLRGTEIFVTDHRLQRKEVRAMRYYGQGSASTRVLVVHSNCRKIDPHSEPDD